MLIVGVDVETNGLDSAEHEVIEFGGVLFCTIAKRVLATFGKIYKVEKWCGEAEKCHRITREMSDLMPTFQDDGIIPSKALSIHLAEFVVAHNAGHDHPFVTKLDPGFLKVPWICTQRDLKHEDKIDRVSSRRLAHLCVDYHLPMGSWHQAVADAEACARIAGEHDLKAAYKWKITPKFRLLAYGPYLAHVGKDAMNQCPSVLAGGQKYRWNTDEYPRAWMGQDLTEEFVAKDAKYIKEVTEGQWKFEAEPMLPKPY